MFANKLKKSLLKSLENSYNLTKTKKELSFSDDNYQMKKNKSHKMFIGLIITTCIIILFLLPNFISFNKHVYNTSYSLYTTIPDGVYCRIEVLDEDPRVLYDYNYFYDNRKPEPIYYKHYTVQIHEIYYGDTTYRGKNVATKDIIEIAYPIEFSPIINNNSEYLIDLRNFKIGNLQVNSEEGLQNIFVCLYSGKVNDDLSLYITPIVDGVLKLPEPLPGFLLKEGNRLISDSQYHIRNGMTNEELRKYFELIKIEVENRKITEKKGCA